MQPYSQGSKVSAELLRHCLVINKGTDELRCQGALRATTARWAHLHTEPCALHVAAPVSHVPDSCLSNLGTRTLCGTVAKAKMLPRGSHLPAQALTGGCDNGATWQNSRRTCPMLPLGTGVRLPGQIGPRAPRLKTGVASVCSDPVDCYW